MVARRENSLPSLTLSAKRLVWRMNDHADEADKAFQRVRKGILEAHDYKCLFCGHRSEKHQEVHHLDDNHSNNDPVNLATSCPLCHQVFHIGLAGMQDGADIIYAPEFTQAEINQFALVIWLVSEGNSKELKDPEEALQFDRIQAKAKMVESMMEGRRGTVLLRLRKALKEHSSFPEEYLDKIKLSHLSPLMFANVLMALDDKTYAQRESLLGGLRLWPKPMRFRKQIAHWKTEQDATLPVPTWFRIISEDDVIRIIVTCSEQLEQLIRVASVEAEE